MTTRLTKLSFTPIKQSFLFAVFFMISMVSFAQLSVDAGKDTTNDNKPEWAPVGAKWYFNHPNSTSGNYVAFESKKDSVIQGKNSRVIDVRLNGASLVGQEYI